jgi:hypothetical protein
MTLPVHAQQGAGRYKGSAAKTHAAKVFPSEKEALI